MNRREFLRQTACGFAAVVAPRNAPGRRAAGVAGDLSPAIRTGASRKIVIVGAGLAGMSAAYELADAGHDVTILEARTRPGGRVFTMREPFADGLYAEAGAMQVFDVHQRVMRYITLLGLDIDPIQPAPATSVLHVMGTRIEVRPGTPPAWPFDLANGEKGLTTGALWAKYVSPIVKEVGEAEAAGAFPSAVAQYDRETFSEFLRKRGASTAAMRLMNIGLPSGLGDGPDAVSALNLLREAVHRDERKQSYTIRGGTDRLPRALAARLADRIRYGSPVTAIEHDAGGVRVIVQQGGSSRTLAAEHAICAVPFTVLRTIRISPALSREKRSAIDGLQYTSVVRTFVQTRTRFWSGRGWSGNASTDLPVMGVYERTINQQGTRGILESYTAGAQARRLTAMTEAARQTVALEGMRRVFPGIDDEYEAGASKAWDADEWSRGAYAWFRPGEMTTLLPHIARPEGRIHFAGEHASSHPGWMEGALESGSRAAAEILNS